MRHYQIAVLALGLAALCPPAPVTAQEVHLRGRVVDNQSLAPISAAQVMVSTAAGKRMGELVSDQEGHFVFTVPEPGGYVFRAERIGYEATETPILWTDDFSTFSVEIRLDPDAVLLAPIEVIARSRAAPSPVLENFHARLESGLGHFFTRDDVEKLRPSRVTDLLARVPGVRLESSGAGLRRSVFFSRGGLPCRAQIFVDGMLWTRPDMLRRGGDPGFTVDDAVSPASIEGIEVYRGLSGIPAEFLTPEARCGVVAIWTRR